MKQPKSIFDLDGSIILYPEAGREYSNKPLSKWDHDCFANYILDMSDIDNKVHNNYFMKCMKHYFDDVPKVNNPKVLLYGIFDIIEGILKGNI